MLKNHHQKSQKRQQPHKYRHNKQNIPNASSKALRAMVEQQHQLHQIQDQKKQHKINHIKQLQQKEGKSVQYIKSGVKSVDENRIETTDRQRGLREIVKRGSLINLAWNSKEKEGNSSLLPAIVVRKKQRSQDFRRRVATQDHKFSYPSNSTINAKNLDMTEATQSPFYHKIFKFKQIKSIDTEFRRLQQFKSKNQALRKQLGGLQTLILKFSMKNTLLGADNRGQDVDKQLYRGQYLSNIQNKDVKKRCKKENIMLRSIE